MITALMAGENGEPNAKKIFDGMWKFRKNYPSKGSNGWLMDWAIGQGEVATGGSSATDGDIDIAYALLLANAQWGGSPEGETSTYAELAGSVLTEIKNRNISSKFRTQLGDWSTSEEDTRPSDWIPDHFRSFAKAQQASSSVWNQVSDTVYSMIGAITSGYSSKTGMMPDFVTGTQVKPDENAGSTGEKNPKMYGWNSCRYPWRITTDYAMWRTASAKNAVVKLTDYITATYPEPSNIYSGPYNISTGATSQKNTENGFSAPFIAGAIVDEKYQSYLDKGWAYLQTTHDEGDAYNAAIKLMSMMVISGNWWKPTDSPSGVITGPDTTIQYTFDDFGLGLQGQTDMGAAIGAKKYGSTVDKDSCGLWYVWTWANSGEDVTKENPAGKGTKFTNLAGVALESHENGANNAGDMVKDGIMGFRISKGTLDSDAAGIGVSFGQSKGVTDLATDYYDLSNMTAILIRVKGKGEARISIATKLVKDEAEDEGHFGTEIIGVSDQWQTIIVDPSTFMAQTDSKAATKLLKWSDAKKACSEIGIEATTQELQLEIDFIKLCGVTESTFGLEPVVGNQKPTDISLSNLAIKSDIAVGGAVGSVTVTDPNTADTHTLELLDNSGDAFELSGKEIKVKKSLGAGVYTIKLKATDNGGLFIEKNISITVTDASANNPVTDITLSGMDVETTDAAGTVVGAFKAIDADSKDTHTYSLESGDDNFELTGNELKLKKSIPAGKYVVKVKVTDSGKPASSLEKEFTIVSSEPEAPKTLLESLGWYAEADIGEGLTKSTLTGGKGKLEDTDMFTNGILRCEFNFGKTDGNGTTTDADDLYPMAYLASDSIRVNDVPTSLANSNSITITYKSDAAFGFYLPMDTIVTGGNDFQTTLPSTKGAESTVTITLDATKFKQVDIADWGIKATFNKSQMYSLMFNPTVEGSSSYLEISDIKIDGIVGIKDEMKKLAFPNQLMMTLTGSKMNIAAPRAGTYTVSLYSVYGRLLKDLQVQLNAGQNSISWNGSDFGSKMIISRVQGAGLSMTQKYLIK